MKDERHLGRQLDVDVFENVRLRVGEESQAVPAHARVRAGHVFAEAVFAEHVVFGTCDVGSERARAHRCDAGFQGFDVDREGALLRVAGLADDERAADLREVALDRRREFGDDEVAVHELAVRGRGDAADIRAAGSDQHEVIGDALGAQPRFHFGDDFVLRAAFACGFTEDHVRFVGRLDGFAYAVDLGRRLVHQHVVDEQRTVADFDVRIPDEREGHERERSGGDANVPARREVGGNVASDLLAEAHLDAGRFRCRAIDFACAVQIEPAGAVRGEHGQAVAFEDREVADVLEVVALPTVTVGGEDVDAGCGHRRSEFGAPFRGERGGFHDRIFTGTNRVVYMFFGSRGRSYMPRSATDLRTSSSAACEKVPSLDIIAMSAGYDLATTDASTCITRAIVAIDASLCVR